jgi:hypothetical protein
MAIPTSTKRRAWTGLSVGLVATALAALADAPQYGVAILVATSFSWWDIAMWLSGGTYLFIADKGPGRQERAEEIYFSPDFAAVRRKWGEFICLAAGFAILLPSEVVAVSALLLWGLTLGSLCFRDALRAVGLTGGTS